MAKLPKLHFDSFVADLHCDTALQILRGYDFSKRNNNYHVDLPRLKEGGVNLQIFAAFAESNLPKGERFSRADRLLDSLIAEINKHPDEIVICYSYQDILDSYDQEKIAAVLAIENGMAIEDNLSNLEYFYNKGVRYMTLTHAKSHSWCSSSSDDKSDEFGLTEFGYDVIKKMNSLGMIVDVSHISVKAFFDVIKVTDSPVIASHSNAQSLCSHDRNLNDEQLIALKENGGMTGMNFCCEFLSDEILQVTETFFKEHPDELKKFEDLFGDEKSEDQHTLDLSKIDGFIKSWKEKTVSVRPSQKTVADHIEHIIKIAGIDQAGLGSDYDGIFNAPKNLEDISCLPSLTQELISRGLSDENIKKILGGNFLRIAQTVFK